MVRRTVLLKGGKIMSAVVALTGSLAGVLILVALIACVELIFGSLEDVGKDTLLKIDPADTVDKKYTPTP
jgi:hypothetical protein